MHIRLRCVHCNTHRYTLQVVKLTLTFSDASEIKVTGMKHYECFFNDCTVPSPQLVKRFLDICDFEKGMIAVHCLAGLGRTGTLIAVWMMQEHDLTARECIAWLRICRPGSVIGPQQHFLEACQVCLLISMVKS